MEIWKPLVGYEGLYEISSIGRVKRLKRNFNRKREGYKPETVLIPEKILNPSLDGGYMRINLKKGKIQKRHRVHRLVAISFIEKKPKGKPHINHIDGNKLNNLYTNLEWCTPKENNHHATITGLTPEIKKGSQSHHAKSVNQICINTNVILATFNSIIEASIATCVHKDNISRNCLNKCKSAGGFRWEFA